MIFYNSKTSEITSLIISTSACFSLPRLSLLKRLSSTAGELLEIRLLDHVIISTEGYYSFADEGMI